MRSPRHPPVKKNPYFDVKNHTLYYRRQIVKEFHRPADNQELIVLAFEEQVWVFPIDDPLPPKGHMNPKKRLNDAVRRLNERQKKALLRFHVTNSGRSITWEAL